MNRRSWIGLFCCSSRLCRVGVGLAAWKYTSIQETAAASANQPEPIESVTVALAKEVEHRQTATSIGTVLALRSITLRNELAGTVRYVSLTPGQIVDAGRCSSQLDVSVEEAELKAQEAQAALARGGARPQSSARARRAAAAGRKWIGRAQSATSRWRRSRAPRR